MTRRIPSSEFLPLKRQGESGRFTLDVTFDLCSGRGDLWGGVGLAASISALTKLTEGRPLILASTQFLSNKSGAKELILEAELPVHRRTISHGTITGYLDEVKFIRVSAWLGKRDGEDTVDRVTPIEIPPVSDCPDIDLGTPRTAMHTHTETRLARGMFGVEGQGEPSDDGRLSMWLRMPQVECGVEALSILADYMPSGIGNSIGKVVFGISLDNTLRIAKLVPTDWVQCDVTIEHVGDGLAYGTAHMFSQDGILMATASQSMVLRFQE